ncbi:urease accessory protein UreF [Effusibacillus dendaii]|uniref:Urease accessory protein UreF n=1 Tax=Effusibacillus dendaii TaxID=2743772 RepID=A0A7I8D563_9BACL|nr:urease accessory protein UreF [Effusibacillus dendaii]BCJ85207.1 urease accessory protein UreF [Effusibacillus dendaii]
MNDLLAVMQLTDSAFPTGAFTHSFGLETAVQEGWVANGNQLTEWLVAYIKGSLIPMEGAALVWARHYASKRLQDRSRSVKPFDDQLQMIDQRLTVSRMARESREGAIKIGRRYLQIAQELYPLAGLQEYARWIEEKVCHGSSPVVHGWICSFLGVSPRITAVSFIYGGVNSLIQNAIRLMPIGQTEGQKVLARLLPVVEQEIDRLLADLPQPDQIFQRTIRQEIASMRHEQLYSRLFMS